MLDEPTNDLDLETLDLLQEFLADYPGTVLLVSHDRDFLDRVCTSVIASKGDGIWTEYAGGYSDMLAQCGNTPKPEPQKPKSKQKAKPKSAEPKDNSDKLTFKQQHALKTLPKEIERLEFEISKLQAALAKPGLYDEDPKKFNAWATELKKREELLSSKETQWLELEMLAEELKE